MIAALRTRTRRLTARSGDGSLPRVESSTTAPTPIWTVVARFMLASLVALVVFGIIGLFVQRHLSTQEEIRNATEHASLAARLINPVLTDAALTPGDPAQATLDKAVRSEVLDGKIVRIKIWKPDGTIAYSDATPLIGQRYELDADDLETINDGKVFANLSDLSEPENKLEAPFGELLQVYLPAKTTSGEPLMFEIYERYDDIVAGGRRLWWIFALPLVLSILLLWLAQAPLAWSLARRLRVDQRERERLLRRAIETSNLERRRVAADLHDGVVQQLAGTAYNLAAAAETTFTPEAAPAKRALEESIVNVRQVIRQLRSLIVEIHPPNLRSEGLKAAITDLTSQLGARGIDVHLDVAGDVALGQDAEELCFRAAQEGIRNVVAHAGARNVTVRFMRRGDRAVLTVADDGNGFDPTACADRAKDGHVGLSLLGELANDMGGAFHIRSAPGAGCEIELEVPWK